MVDTWFNRTLRDDSTRKYKVIDYSEIQPPTAELKSKLIQVILNHRFNIEVLYDLLKQSNLPLWSQFVQDTLPTIKRLRNATFGEVLSAEISEKFDLLTVPVRKPRYCSGRNETQHGTDLLALRFDEVERMTEVHFGEVKVRASGTDRTKACEAHEQLKVKASEGFSEILMFVVHRLKELGHPAYQHLLQYMRSRQNSEDMDFFEIFLIFQKNKWTENNLNDLDQVVALAPLSVHVVLIQNLQQLVSEIFDGMSVRP